MTVYRNAAGKCIFYHRRIGIFTLNSGSEFQFAADFSHKENLDFITLFYGTDAVFIGEFGGIDNAFAFCVQIDENSFTVYRNDSRFNFLSGSQIFKHIYTSCFSGEFRTARLFYYFISISTGGSLNRLLTAEFIRSAT